MKNIKESISGLFKSKKMRYGTNATIVTVGFLAVLVVINLIVGTLVQKLPLKADLTKNKMYSFSQQTLDILKQLKQPITIYELYAQGKEDAGVQEILDRYAKKTNQIKIQTIDPNKNPGFAQKYDTSGQGLAEGSIIFESGSKFKVVSSSDIVTQDYQTGESSLNAEQSFTSAIIYVTSDKIPSVYFTQGHGEVNLSSVKSALESENYKPADVNLLTGDIPQDAELVIVSSPKKDFTADEINKLDSFFDKGGRAIFLADVSQDELPKLESYLKEWGMELQKDYIVEGSQNNYYQNPIILLPEVQSHDITSQIKSKNLFVLVPQARSIKMLFQDQNGIKVTSLLKSSAAAYGKVNLTSQVPQKEQGDLSGPFDIATVATKTTADGQNEARLLVVGSSMFVQDNILSNPQFASLANKDLFMNSVNWMQNKKENITIRPKSLKPEGLNMTQMQAIILSGIVVLLIPILVFIIGAVVWIRRKHL